MEISFNVNNLTFYFKINLKFDFRIKHIVSYHKMFTTLIQNTCLLSIENFLFFSSKKHTCLQTHKPIFSETENQCFIMLIIIQTQNSIYIYGVFI